LSRGRPTFFLLTLSLLLPAYARPQDAVGEPEDGGLASRIARWLEQPRRIQQQLAGVGVVPILSGFAQGTGPAPGLSVFRPRLIGPLDVTLAGGFSLHGDSFQDVRVGRLPHEAGSGAPLRVRRAAASRFRRRPGLRRRGRRDPLPP
jgi:hypothetical protein